MSVKKCEVCQIVCQDDYSYEAHIKGKKHIKNTEDLDKVQSLSQRSIFVGNLPAYLVKPENSRSLISFFRQFGKIIFFKFGFRNLIIEYESSETVDYLLANNVYYDNIKLNVSQRIVKYDKTKNQKKTEKKAPEAINNTNELDYKNIKHIFEKDVPFEEQLSEFLSTISIDADEINKRYDSTRISLQNCFKKSIPNCTAHRFGSTVTGLGFKNCDLDIFLDTGLPVVSKPNSPPKLKTAASVFSDVKRMLYFKSNVFSNVVPIPKAKTPIIKFTYIPTNISIDLSFKNSLAVYNSKLVNHLLSTNEILRPAMLVIKYWVCNYELYCTGRISKYALTLLFIFYCQQPAVQLLPPILELKKQVEPEIVEGWQVNFKEETINRCTSNPSIPELLHGFFDFYANYNFKLNVICPVDGMSHKKIILNSVETLPDSMEFYKEYLKTRESALTFPLTKPMCVQDPNELNHNVTGYIEARYLELFQKYCEQAAALCKTEASNDYKNFLASLFTLRVVVPKESKESPVISFVFYANNLLEVGLPKNIDEACSISEDRGSLTENWLDLVINLTQKFFEKVLQLQVQFIDEQELKQQKVGTKSDVHTNDSSKVVMHCTGYSCLWRDRKGCARSIDPSLSMIEKEAFVSQAIYKLLTSKNRANNEKINFECNILRKPAENPYILIRLTNIDGEKSIYNECSSYIKSKLPVILEKTLLHMEQYRKEADDLNF